jgi:hypothetical protein
MCSSVSPRLQEKHWRKLKGWLLKENRAPWKAASQKQDLGNGALESIHALEKGEEEIHVESA